MDRFQQEIENSTKKNVCDQWKHEKVFYSTLAELLSIKRKVETSLVVSWMRTKLSYDLTRPMLTGLQGSRMLKNALAFR